MKASGPNNKNRRRETVLSEAASGGRPRSQGRPTMASTKQAVVSSWPRQVLLLLKTAGHDMFTPPIAALPLHPHAIGCMRSLRPNCSAQPPSNHLRRDARLRGAQAAPLLLLLLGCSTLLGWHVPHTSNPARRRAAAATY